MIHPPSFQDKIAFPQYSTSTTSNFHRIEPVHSIDKAGSLVTAQARRAFLRASRDFASSKTSPVTSGL
jgi:hypothetical protein